MKKYPSLPPENDLVLNDAGLDQALEFPVADFHSYAPTIDPEAMLRRIEENMPWRSTRPGEKERRAAQGIAVEFVL
jgi:hypothetical protein